VKKAARIVIIGGGWAGCSAAAVARKAGAEVVLLERTDMLLGTGLVGGIYRNNGRYTAAEEMTALGSDFFTLLDTTRVHKDVEFPGHKHASLYGVWTIEPVVKRHLLGLGVRVVTQARVTDIARSGRRVTAVSTKEEKWEGDAFIDATGSSAVPANCTKHGNGCAMCILRCHSFGARTDLPAKVGVTQWDAEKPGGSLGAMSGSCKLAKKSLSPDIVKALEKNGSLCVPVPESVKEDVALLNSKACQQYALKEFIDNLVLLDTGPVKLMSPYFPLDNLRKVPGMENARFEDPLAGGKGNSMRYFGFADCDATLKANGGVDNLFCAGEKAGAMVGHTEVIVTGSLAGHNAARLLAGEQLLQLPDSLAVGDLVNSTIAKMKDPEGRRYKYTFSGSVYFTRMKERGLYLTDDHEIAENVKKTGLAGLFAKKIL
jgi:hypothetical protein